MNKKILILLILSILFIPFNISAYGIDNYNIDATVLTNGDLHVKECFALNGGYNGFNKLINYKNVETLPFDNTVNSFGGSDIYNADNIKLIKIMGVSRESCSNLSNIEGDTFSNVNNALNGDYGKYITTAYSNGYNYQIYNPSSYNRAFYIEYIISNLAVVHNDVAEIGWNIFTELTESVGNLNVVIKIPNNNSNLRAWAHGPLIGEIDIISNEQIMINVKGLNANDPVDARFVFSKDSVLGSTKYTNVDALDKILEYENIQAEKANLEREKANREMEKAKLINNIMTYTFLGLKIMFVVGLGIIVFRVYKKHDKEYKSDFFGEYFRDFPAEYGPEVVGYLLNRNISTNDFSALFLNLIYKKKIKFEIIDKKNYLFKYDGNSEGLNESEQALIKFVFGAIDVYSETTLEQIKKSAKSYETFILGYDTWKHVSLGLAEQENFYESKINVKLKSILYCIVGILICIFSFNYPFTKYSTVINGVLLILTIIALVYFAVFTKRTQKGKNDYVRWIGLKKFLEDFSRFDEKDLPDITLWEKYLVYAVSLGCADKLSKTMKIKISDLEQNGANIGGMMIDYYYFRSITDINRVINNSINSSVTSAYSARDIANSRSSSSGGFGGGFSSGGGSFGGGGGGGRF